MTWYDDIVIDIHTLRIGDELTFREGVTSNGLEHGDRLVVTDIRMDDYNGEPDTCPVYVISPDRKTGNNYIDNSGFGFFISSYEYYINGICADCKSSCKVNNKEECVFYEERGSK